MCGIRTFHLLALMRICCPHCNTSVDDDIEAFDTDRLDWLRCDTCELEYAFVIVECVHCVAETSFAWKVAPALEVVARLRCSSCGMTAHRVDTPEEELD